MPPLFVVIPLLLVVYWLVDNFYLKRRAYPPGPTPLPLAGNMVTLLKAKDGVAQQLCEWSKTYGSVYTMWMGPKPVIIVDDLDIVRDEFVKNGDAYKHRPSNPLSELKWDGMNGVVMSSDEKWRENRRFTLRVFRDFGVGKTLMEDQVAAEEMMVYLDDNCDCETNLSPAFEVTVSNIISRLLWSNRNEHGSDSFHELKGLLDEHIKAVLHPAIVTMQEYTWLRHFPYFNTALNDIDTRLEHFLSYIRKHIVEHRNNFNPDDEPEDYTYAYLKEIHDRGVDNAIFGLRQLEFVCLDLWFAGLETTVTTLNWAFLHTVTRPDVQAKIHKEIDGLQLSLDQQVTMKDKVRLPYVQAVINEVQRCGNIIPINLLREVRQSVTLGGYTIPAGTAVVPSIGSLMASDKLWENASDFDPSRHMTADEKGIQKQDALLPFSLGKRACMGEAMARMELFLIYANLLKNYTLHKVPGELYDLKPIFGLTTNPSHYKVRLEKRTT